MNINQDLIYSLIGTRIRKRRMDLGRTQADLADKLNIARTSIANIEAGSQQSPLYVIYMICEELGIGIHDLLPSMSEVSISKKLKVQGGELTPEISKLVDNILETNK